MEIKIDIKDCSRCPHFESERVYTADSFENVEKWTCKKANKEISGFVEWHDKIAIPEWCPCRISSESTYKKILNSYVVYLNGKIIKNRYGKEDMIATTDDIRDAVVDSWDENTNTLYLKTK